MIKIEHLIEMDSVKELSPEVIKVIAGVVTTLDNEYGEDRDADQDGGYVLIIESIDDFETVKEEFYLDLHEDAVPEFVDKIVCSHGTVYTNSLILCNNDFGISVVIPLELTTDNLKKHIVE